jgi:hypothetical protein
MDAVLNVGDLEALLASGAVTVTTTGFGVEAKNIRVVAPFSWGSGNALSLDAYSSIAIDNAVGVDAVGAVSLVMDGGGLGGALTFGRKGLVSFASIESPLTIDGVAYRLENNLDTLAYDIARKPGGDFALASTVDADGVVWSNSPIDTTFNGTLEGLGNVIAKLTIVDQSDSYVGLLAAVGKKGVVRDIGLSGAVVKAYGEQPRVGVLAGSNEGTILRAHTTGRARGTGLVGGLVGYNTGKISRCWSSAVSTGEDEAGGLVGDNEGPIDSSFATGNVTGTSDTWVGGLVGTSYPATIANSYATGQVRSRVRSGEGGLVGLDNGGSIQTSYSIGKIVDAGGENDGGFLGDDEGTVASDYWDTTTSGTTDGVDGGNEANVTGLTTAQLQAGIPAGFDPKIWAEDANINGGLPYLVSNPPK